MEKFYNAYIQQIKYDGTEYTAGEFRNLHTDFGCGVISFPFKPFAEAKDPVTRDWVDEDGTDFYIPSDGQLLKSYDIDVEFIFKGAEATMKSNIKNFLNFIYGRNSGGSGRLAIFDEFVGIGRKDVRVKSHEPDVFFIGDGGIDSVATFKVKFEVHDPSTDVTCTKSSGKVTALTFSGLKSS